MPLAKKVHTQFQPKLVRVYTHFQTKMVQKNTFWDGTYLLGLYRTPLPMYR